MWRISDMWRILDFLLYIVFKHVIFLLFSVCLYFLSSEKSSSAIQSSSRLHKLRSRQKSQESKPTASAPLKADHRIVTPRGWVMVNLNYPHLDAILCGSNLLSSGVIICIYEVSIVVDTMNKTVSDLTVNSVIHTLR